MEEENKVIEETLKAQEEESLNDSQGSEQSDVDYKTLWEKEKERAENQKIRAEKAEKLAKSIKTTDSQTSVKGDLSLKDIKVLQDVHEEDIEDIIEYAKFKNISLAEAKKSTVIQSLLKDKEEQRTVANAANTGGSKRGSGKVPDDVLLSKASKGELPDNDADLERLIKLRKGIK